MDQLQEKSIPNLRSKLNKLRKWMQSSAVIRALEPYIKCNGRGHFHLRRYCKYFERYAHGLSQGANDSRVEVDILLGTNGKQEGKSKLT